MRKVLLNSSLQRATFKLVHYHIYHINGTSPSISFIILLDQVLYMLAINKYRVEAEIYWNDCFAYIHS